MCSIERTNNITMQAIERRTNQCYDDGTMCPIERTSNVTIWEDKSTIGAVAQCYQYNVFYQGECSYRQGSCPMLFMHIMWPPWKETISHFCDTLEIEEIKCFLWNFSYPDPTLHTLRLVSPWGRPGTYPYCPIHCPAHSPSGGCPMAQGLQETTIQPREAALWPGTASTVPLAYPSFRNRHTHGTQHTQPSRRPQWPHRLQDYKTA